MLIDRRYRYLEQHRHQLLCQPDRFILDAHLDGAFTRQFGEDQELGNADADLQFFSFMEFLCSAVSLIFGDAILLG